MPQEIEVRYLIPALRKELTKILMTDFDYSQKEVALVLGLTESAVSQYLAAKRATELKFTSIEKEEIKKTAKKIVLNKKNCNEYLYELTVKLRASQNICKLHKKQDKSLPAACKVCCE